MNSLLAIINPVLDSMPESHLKPALRDAFVAQRRHFETIEAGFRALTARRQDPEMLRTFFASWAQTNNSATTVAGIGNRMTLLVHKGADVADERAMLGALASLDRIIDEDLAVTGKVLHAQLFYDMATGIVGDDDWLSQRYVHPTARAFKAWKDANSLREHDLTIALLTTIAHEIYTHGEVEFILPLFERWLGESYERTHAETLRTLAWIGVHCGPTEKNHFFHALDALERYTTAMGVRADLAAVETIVASYLAQKAAVMQAVALDQVGALEVLR
ncbi:MAG: hypothetical protein KGN02_12825 [bacterium]|nr:hypothetical protein [bacterium]